MGECRHLNRVIRCGCACCTVAEKTGVLGSCWGNVWTGSYSWSLVRWCVHWFCHMALVVSQDYRPRSADQCVIIWIVFTSTFLFVVPLWSPWSFFLGHTRMSNRATSRCWRRYSPLTSSAIFFWSWQPLCYSWPYNSMSNIGLGVVPELSVCWLALGLPQSSLSFGNGDRMTGRFFHRASFSNVAWRPAAWAPSLSTGPSSSMLIIFPSGFKPSKTILRSCLESLW